MMQPLNTPQMVQPRRSGVVLPLIIGCGAFAIGVGLTVGYVQWQAQQAKIAEMAEMLEEMQSGGVVARAEPVDLLTTTAPRAEPVEPAVAVAAPAPQPAAPAPAADKPLTTAERIDALVARADDPLVSAALAQDEARRETMSVAIQGVNELAQAALAGDYELTIEPDGETEVLRIWFPENLVEQVKLEKLLSSAAGAGMIAVSDSVASSDGIYDGRIILFDLVERVLTNGSQAERALASKIQQEAVALLAKVQPAAAQTVVSNEGERIYTVQPGDSLAYIALQFYGNTNNYLEIFRANQNLLSSPERIQIGQRLVIPQI